MSWGEPEWLAQWFMSPWIAREMECEGGAMYSVFV